MTQGPEVCSQLYPLVLTALVEKSDPTCIPVSAAGPKIGLGRDCFADVGALYW